MAIEETHYRICLQCDKASHSGKKPLLPGLFKDMLYEMDMKDHRKVTVKLSKRWDGPFMEETFRHSAGHKRKQLMNFVITRHNRSSNFLLHGSLLDATNL